MEAGVEEARKVVDASEMAAMPHCQLDPVGADAGTVYFCQPKDIGIVLRNTGEVGTTPTLMLTCSSERLAFRCDGASP